MAGGVQIRVCIVVCVLQNVYYRVELVFSLQSVLQADLWQQELCVELVDGLEVTEDGREHVRREAAVARHSTVEHLQVESWRELNGKRELDDRRENWMVREIIGW